MVGMRMHKEEELISLEELKRTLRYESETGKFFWLVRPSTHVRPGSEAGYIESWGYRVIAIRGKHYKAHRLAWFYVHGYWPYPQVDHINRDPADNRITNLRCVSQSQNHRNKKRKPRGYCWNKKSNKWQVSFKIPMGKVKYLGLYDKEEDAAKVYKEYMQIHHPEFAAL